MSCPIVSTANGKVKGLISQLNCKDGKPVYTYKNIPFAKPPLGSLRFMPPQKAGPWSGVRDGTVTGNIPMQSIAYQDAMNKLLPLRGAGKMKLNPDEDCLHLSVYTPDASKGKKLPVMFWIYGGGFQMGAEVFFDGSALAGLNDVVVVIPNYRVGAFGFLDIGQSSICPGNAGVLDQIMSLEWVRDNIDAFGGDNSNVTIFGESAGSISVDMLVTSPRSRGLFHKAMSHSGQFAFPGLFYADKKREKVNSAYMKQLKIEEKDGRKIFEALQKLEASEIVKASEVLEHKKIYYCPSLDGELFKKMPRQYLADKDFAKVPYIIGCNNTEGHGLLTLLHGAEFHNGLTKEKARNGFYIPNNDDLADAWEKFYVKDENDEKRYSKFLGDVTGDAQFVEPAVTTAAAHANAGCNIYFYQGAFQLRFNHDDEFGKDMIKKVDWCICDHADDVQMTFGVPFTTGDLPNGAKFSDEEGVLSRKWMTYLTNFAKHGDPNKGKKTEVNWPKYEPKGKYIVVDHKFSIRENLAEKNVEFWAKTVTELKKKYPVDDE